MKRRPDGDHQLEPFGHGRERRRRGPGVELVGFDPFARLVDYLEQEAR